MYEDIKMRIKPYCKLKLNMIKFITLCQTSSKKFLVNHANFMILASEIRKQIQTNPPPIHIII